MLQIFHEIMCIREKKNRIWRAYLERGGRRNCPFMGGGNFSLCEGDYVRPQRPLCP